MNWHGNWKIPKRIKLPGVTVHIRPIPKEQEADYDGMWVYSDSQDKAYIYLDTSLPIEVQRYVILHELQHAAIELVDVMIEKYPDHVRTKHMADTVNVKET